MARVGRVARFEVSRGGWKAREAVGRQVRCVVDAVRLAKPETRERNEWGERKAKFGEKGANSRRVARCSAFDYIFVFSPPAALGRSTVLHATALPACSSLALAEAPLYVQKAELLKAPYRPTEGWKGV